jgi:hypothetical protein
VSLAIEDRGKHDLFLGGDIVGEATLEVPAQAELRPTLRRIEPHLYLWLVKRTQIRAWNSEDATKIGGDT